MSDLTAVQIHSCKWVTQTSFVLPVYRTELGKTLQTVSLTRVLLTQP